jgi:putative redox protein
MDKVELNWQKDMEFIGQGAGEVKINIDGKKKEGANPPELLLMSLGSCSGIHLKMLLDKMRIEFDDLKVEASGERAEDSPRYFTEIELIFKVWGKEIAEEKFEKALKLAIDHCGIWNTIGNETDINYSYEIK